MPGFPPNSRRGVWSGGLDQRGWEPGNLGSVTAPEKSEVWSSGARSLEDLILPALPVPTTLL